LETIKLLRLDLERKNDELEKLRALYDAVTVQHKSLLAEREREKTRLASESTSMADRIHIRLSPPFTRVFPVTATKPYQPDRFTQVLSPVETVHAENEQLKYLVSTSIAARELTDFPSSPSTEATLIEQRCRECD
jgi:hypothetical protein